MPKFSKPTLKKLFVPAHNSHGEQNGQVTIIGGSSLFHGAPIFGLKIASRIVDMVFFGSPEPSIGEVASQLKSKLSSFIWIPWEEAEDYVAKSDAVLIGNGFMRFRREKNADRARTEVCDIECRKTQKITKHFLTKFSDKKWVIDAGSLQTMDPTWIPENAILTPNRHEYKFLFGDIPQQVAAKQYNCIIVRKGPVTTVCSPKTTVEINGGNPGLTKGGTGDVQAGLTVALLAKNDPMLAACAASFITKAAAEQLYKTRGTFFNADDLADKIPEVLINNL